MALCYMYFIDISSIIQRASYAQSEAPVRSVYLYVSTGNVAISVNSRLSVRLQEVVGKLL